MTANEKRRSRLKGICTSAASGDSGAPSHPIIGALLGVGTVNTSISSAGTASRSFSRASGRSSRRSMSRVKPSGNAAGGNGRTSALLYWLIGTSMSAVLTVMSVGQVISCIRTTGEAFSQVREA